MDEESVNYSEARYTEIKNELLKTLKTIGFGKADEFNFIPTSGWTGLNIMEKDGDKTAWYKGPCLLEAIDGLKPPKRPTDKPLRLPIQDVYKINGVGTVPAGRVESGVMKPGMNVVFAPSPVVAEVKSVEMHHEQLPQAIPGDNIGFNVRNIAVKDIKKGYVVGDVAKNPPGKVNMFTAQVIIMNHPKTIHPGYTPVIDCHTNHMACKFEAFTQKLDMRTMKVKEENPADASKGECVIVKIAPTKEFSAEPYDKFPALGRFAVRDMKRTVAVGVIKETEVVSCMGKK